jgi:hypothetical protein
VLIVCKSLGVVNSGSFGFGIVLKHSATGSRFLSVLFLFDLVLAGYSLVVLRDLKPRDFTIYHITTWFW